MFLLMALCYLSVGKSATQQVITAYLPCNAAVFTRILLLADPVRCSRLHAGRFHPEGAVLLENITEIGVPQSPRSEPYATTLEGSAIP